MSDFCANNGKVTCSTTLHALEFFRHAAFTGKTNKLTFITTKDLGNVAKKIRDFGIGSRFRKYLIIFNAV